MPLSMECARVSTVNLNQCGKPDHIKIRSIPENFSIRSVMKLVESYNLKIRLRILDNFRVCSLDVSVICCSQVSKITFTFRNKILSELIEIPILHQYINFSFFVIKNLETDNLHFSYKYAL